MTVGGILALPGCAGEGVGHAEEKIARDVLEVAAVAEPGAGRGDVVGRALALRFDEQRQVDVIVAVPSGERGQNLQPIGSWRHGDGDFGSIVRGCYEAGLAGIEATRGEVLADGGVEPHVRP